MDVRFPWAWLEVLAQLVALPCGVVVHDQVVVPVPLVPLVGPHLPGRWSSVHLTRYVVW